MGLKLSKQGPGKIENLSLHNHLINCLSNSFYIRNLVYNLYKEETYDPSHFYGRVEAYPFDDNHVPALQMIKIFCESVHSWLTHDPGNIFVVHCTNLPGPCIRELRRIRLYDIINIDRIFFVISELQEKSNQMYRPYVEVSRNCRRQIKKGYERICSSEYHLSFTNECVVVQMDTESPIIYQKTCLDHCFDKPLQTHLNLLIGLVTGDVRVIFYQKMFGGRLFYCCFNTAFIRNGLLQLTLRDLDKVGKNGRSICGPAFCLELLFGPANAKQSLRIPSGNDAECDNLF
ncbi:hypothetical protein CIPAW_04G058900 [Carya illinoinensis]|uniref:C2 tensin-type domain-containing protein n=2 Tax=Carya illinoinensis TaxID=32201 RepID=A0A8T1QR69_CARIL|nr:hypothetical protein CIPAW_04G058900 [Carya illinoinensis]